MKHLSGRRQSGRVEGRRVTASLGITSTDKLATGSSHYHNNVIPKPTRDVSRRRRRWTSSVHCGQLLKLRRSVVFRLHLSRCRQRLYRRHVTQQAR